MSSALIKFRDWCEETCSDQHQNTPFEGKWIIESSVIFFSLVSWYESLLYSFHIDSMVHKQSWIVAHSIGFVTHRHKQKCVVYTRSHFLYTSKILNYSSLLWFFSADFTTVSSLFKEYKQQERAKKKKRIFRAGNFPFLYSCRRINKKVLKLKRMEAWRVS